MVPSLLLVDGIVSLRLDGKVASLFLVDGMVTLLLLVDGMALLEFQILVFYHDSIKYCNYFAIFKNIAVFCGNRKYRDFPKYRGTAMTAIK